MELERCAVSYEKCREIEMLNRDREAKNSSSQIFECAGIRGAHSVVRWPKHENALDDFRNEFPLGKRLAGTFN